MPSWNDLVAELGALQPQAKGPWLQQKQGEWLNRLAVKQGGRNILFYGSGFLQKPQVSPIFLQISLEDVNGLMAVMNGMDWSKGLTILLHTPGGITSATETIVEYLHQKFTDIEVIIPTYAMSAGTMISLAANRLVMGRQSQLGPIDPQMPFGGRTVSARAIVDQFNVAKTEILADVATASVWAPVLQALGPSLLQEAQYALSYGETMVSRWLERRHFSARPDKAVKSAAVANYFNRSNNHTSHGRRIDRDEARAQDLTVTDLETDQDLQDIVLTNYHIGTLIFELTPCTKFIVGNHGKTWLKNMSANPTSTP